jgi:hypothetical protein
LPGGHRLVQTSRQVVLEDDRVFADHGLDWGKQGGSTFDDGTFDRKAESGGRIWREPSRGALR